MARARPFDILVAFLSIAAAQQPAAHLNAALNRPGIDPTPGTQVDDDMGGMRKVLNGQKPRLLILVPSGTKLRIEHVLSRQSVTLFPGTRDGDEEQRQAVLDTWAEGHDNVYFVTKGPVNSENVITLPDIAEEGVSNRAHSYHG